MESFTPPAVAIDGEKIRRIREEKRLTQLYVSKVVGVTTDTVSRWENNRYPTIMSDNAVKLADALEVELESILKQENDAEELEESSLPQKPSRIKWIVLLLLAATVVLFFLLIIMSRNNQPIQVLGANRTLPTYAAPGSKILVQVELSVEKNMKGMILKESFPSGWRLVESEPAVSHFDIDAGVARWIFRKPLENTKVLYLLEVPCAITSGTEVEISGELIAHPDGQRSVTTVRSINTMQVKPIHWVDTNGDQIINDLEILDLYDLTEPVQNMNIGWDLVDEIWEAGGYRWDKEKKQFIPSHKTVN
ncbi:MAG: helix-turn-helix transcriptional regulator [Desulfuromonadales bacterium]|nr:helix-turn-helix transcriptional regulator [Desulfuromonadales bacterium]